MPPRPPHFVLLTPTDRPQIDTAGVLHLRWQQLGGEHEADPPATFFVRFSHADGTVVLRTGVSLTGDSYDLDLRDLPGHHQCLVQVIASNDYHTSYVQPPSSPPPVRPPRLLSADSLTSLTGGSLDVRTLGAGTHALAVTATDPDGLTVTQQLEPYNGITGLRMQPQPGL